MLSPCLFNLYAEYILRNAGLGEAQAGIKIARRNINNLRYADLAENEEELKSRLMKVKEESGNAGLKLNIQKWYPKKQTNKQTKKNGIQFYDFMANRWGKVEIVIDFILGAPKSL